MPRLYDACGAARVRRQGALTAVAPDAGSSRKSTRSFSTQPCPPDVAQCECAYNPEWVYNPTLARCGAV
jgi:hypothetical protein